MKRVFPMIMVILAGYPIHAQLKDSIKIPAEQKQNIMKGYLSLELYCRYSHACMEKRR